MSTSRASGSRTRDAAAQMAGLNLASTSSPQTALPEIKGYFNFQQPLTGTNPKNLNTTYASLACKFHLGTSLLVPTSHLDQYPSSLGKDFVFNHIISSRTKLEKYNTYETILWTAGAAIEKNDDKSINKMTPLVKRALLKWQSSNTYYIKHGESINCHTELLYLYIALTTKNIEIANTLWYILKGDKKPDGKTYSVADLPNVKIPYHEVNKNAKGEIISLINNDAHLTFYPQHTIEYISDRAQPTNSYLEILNEQKDLQTAAKKAKLEAAKAKESEVDGFVLV